MGTNIPESVKIIYNEQYGSTYRFLADFYRLTGILVENCPLRQAGLEGRYSEEYKGYLNGYYYIALDENTALFVEKD